MGRMIRTFFNDHSEEFPNWYARPWDHRGLVVKIGMWDQEPMFSCAVGAATEGDWQWAQANLNTLKLTGKPSLGATSNGHDTTAFPKYANSGGAIPIWLKGATESSGYVVVSGLSGPVNHKIILFAYNHVVLAR
ncbi:hypothetical protein M231_07577 [Tremella mesenterica]|uniref:Uncharacterized protein n=1 Tax=Tremella mesenterica TaxID=5217 RepID=A0A4Q1BDY5_TREME|nr:hypothetical protein M231_07577 [Tremella mesenterica]